MRMTIARTAGFCWGVRRTVNKVLETISDAKADTKVATLGPVIHNPQVIAKFESQGVKVYERVRGRPGRNHAGDPDARRRGPRAGARQGPQARRYRRNVSLRKIPQVMAQRLSRDGYHLIIVGDAKHAEIKGVASYAEGPFTILRTGEEIPVLPGVKKVAVISQTTNDATYFKKVVGEASVRFREVRAVNTICYDTGERQTEVRELCDQVEVLVVVGGRMSANTRHLAEIGSEILPADRVHHVERAEELQAAWFVGFQEIGISAGASTPDDVIDSVARMIATFAPDRAAEKRIHTPSFTPTHANR